MDETIIVYIIVKSTQIILVSLSLRGVLFIDSLRAIEMECGKSAFALGGLLKDLEELLGRHVAMTTPNTLHPAIRNKILSETVEL